MTTPDSLQVSDALAFALQCRADARKTFGPLMYAAWRLVTYAEQQLTDEEFDEYKRRITGAGR